MIITHKIKIDMCRRSVPENIDAVQGDGNTRAIQITLTADSVAWEIPSGTTAAVAFLKPDGTKGLYDKLPNGDAAISMSGNTVTAIMAPQVLTCVGAVMASIVFYDRDMDTLATFPFRITAARNPAAGEQVSNDYYEFTTLEEVNEAVKAAIASLEKAKEDFMAETGKAQADFLAKAEEALSVVHGAATEDAPAIVCEATGQTVQVADASNRVLHGLTLYGKTTQNGTPTPESPVPLESVGDSGSVGVTVAGKNLLPNQYYTAFLPYNGVTFSDAGDGKIKINGTAIDNTAFHFVLFTAGSRKFIKAGTYTISGNPTSNTFIEFYTYASQDTSDYIIGVQQSNGVDKTVFVDTDCYYGSYLYIPKGTVVSNAVISPQLERSSVSTAYEPPKPIQTLTVQTPNGLPGIPVTSGGNYTDENGQQWICDEVDLERGVYVKRFSKIVFNGSEEWGITGSTTAAFIEFYTIAAYQFITEALLCDKFPIITFSDRGVKSGIVRGYDASIRLCLNSAEYGIDDVDGLKALLAENPITLEIQLATPIETALSAEELAQYAALHSNKPTTTVYNDAGAGMKVEYVADTKLYIDQKITAISAAMLNA